MTNPARRAKHSGQSAFTYVAGSNYTIVLLTSRGNQLTFIINRGGPLPPPPNPAGESLSLDIYSFYNGTMAALNIRNIGNSSVSLVIYYVRDSAGSTYSNTAWIGPTEIAPNAVSPTDFDINTAGNHCGGCTLL